MSCRYACVCGSICLDCNMRESESYPGEAEDLLSRQLGYKDYDDNMRQIKKQRE